jgi:hypothetical protein
VTVQKLTLPSTALCSVSTALDEGAFHLTSVLSGQFQGITRPILDQSPSHAIGYLLIARECLDSIARTCASGAIALTSGFNALVFKTYNTRRKIIIAAAPSCSELKKVVLCGRVVLDAISTQAWSNDDVSCDEIESILGTEGGNHFMAGREVLAGATTARVQLDVLLLALQQLESLFDCFNNWAKDREFADIEWLRKALVNRECDHEEFLDALLNEPDGVHRCANFTRDENQRYLELKAAIAEELWNQGKPATRRHRSIEELKKKVLGCFRARSRVRPIELGAAPVRPLATLPEAESVEETAVIYDVSDFFDDQNSSLAAQLIKTCVARPIDRAYLFLRLVEGLPPRHVLHELRERFDITDTSFKTIQHRCNRDVRNARAMVGSTPTKRKRSQRDAILRLLALKKRPD